MPFEARSLHGGGVVKFHGRHSVSTGVPAPACLSGGRRADSTPSQLKRPNAATSKPEKFVSMAQYTDGYADRNQWATLWPGVHPRPQPRRLRQPFAVTSDSARRRPRLNFRKASTETVFAASLGKVRPVPAPAPLRKPVPIRFPAQPAGAPPALPPEAESQIAKAGIVGADVAEAAPAAVAAVAPPLPDGQAPSGSQPVAPPVMLLKPQGAKIPRHLGERLRVVDVPPSATPPKPTHWARLSSNKGVQRALAVGKLGADCVDLFGACLASYLTGGAILDVVCNNFKADWYRLVHGAPVSAARPAGAAKAEVGANPVVDLISKLAVARADFREDRSTQVEKTLRRTCWGRGLTFALAAITIGVSGAMVVINPVIGGVMTVLAVYAARQAYANWRLARENLQKFSEGGASSPMGSNALGHVLHEAYLKDPSLELTPSQAQMRATHRSVAVGALSLAASAAVGGVAMGAAVAGATAVTGLRHAARGLGSVVAPVTEVIDSYTSEAGVARLAKKLHFDTDCAEHWKAFFSDQKERVGQYKAALARNQDGRWAPLPIPRPIMATIGPDQDNLDLEPLVRWTRETRRFDDLQAWLALDAFAAVNPGAPRGDNWAERLFTDLQTIDQSRNRARLLTTSGGLTNAAASAVSLAL